MEEYYLRLLPKEEHPAYRAMCTGLMDIATSFKVPRLDDSELAKVFTFVRLDHPELFYAGTFKYRFYSQADSIEFIPVYMFERKKLLDHKQALNSRINKLVQTMNHGSDNEKLLAVHDFICTSVHYDKLKKSYSHEIIGPLAQGVGVCEGIAKAVKVLCDKMNIPCIIAICGNNPQKGIKYGHTWNLVRLNNTWYHLDATFDTSLGTENNVRYDYYCLSDQQIFRDHEPVLYLIPSCPDGNHFYYKEKKLSFTRQEEVQKRIIQAAKKGKSFTFHWRGGYLSREILLELLRLIDVTASEKKLHSHFAINRAQAVITVSFHQEIQGEALEEQQANQEETE